MTFWWVGLISPSGKLSQPSWIWLDAGKFWPAHVDVEHSLICFYLFAMRTLIPPLQTITTSVIFISLIALVFLSAVAYVNVNVKLPYFILQWCNVISGFPWWTTFPIMHVCPGHWQWRKVHEFELSGAKAESITLSLLPGFCRWLFSLFAVNACPYFEYTYFNKCPHYTVNILHCQAVCMCVLAWNKQC